MNIPDETPYTNEELQLPQSDWPTRGIRCPKCNTIIPQFSSLTNNERSRLCDLILNGRNIMAQKELEVFTGAPSRWSKIWVLHSGKPDVVDSSAPCPYCGKPLITARAKQCRYCFMDWHDIHKPKCLK